MIQPTMNKTVTIVLSMLLCITACNTNAPCELSNECDYSPKATTFTVWAGPASAVRLSIYQDAVSEEASTYKMKPVGDGFWRVKVKGDLAGRCYTFSTNIDV